MTDTTDYRTMLAEQLLKVAGRLENSAKTDQALAAQLQQFAPLPTHFDRAQKTRAPQPPVLVPHYLSCA